MDAVVNYVVANLFVRQYFAVITLAKIMKDNHLTLTTMIVVGDAIDNREGLSKLYDGKFTHLFRTAAPNPDHKGE